MKKIMADLRFIPNAVKQRIAQPYYTRKPVTIVGDYNSDQIDSFDAGYMRMMEVMADRLTDELPASTDEEGFGGSNGVVSNFYALRTVAGYPMNPVIVPLLDNANLRKELGLKAGPVSVRHDAIYKRLAQVMFGEHEDASVSIAIRSSMGPPTFVTNIMAKKASLLQLSEEWPVVSEKIQKGDFRSLLSDHAVMLAYRIGSRAQADSVTKDDNGKFSSKDRYVYTKEYALSGGEEGQQIVADKSVHINDSLREGHFAQRIRTVYGFSGSLNYAMAAVMSRFRKVYLDKYEFTWKHQGAEHIKRKIKRYPHVMGFDVSRMDQTVAKWQLDYMFDALAEHLEPDFMDMMMLAFTAPCHVPDPYTDGDNHFWTKDPMLPESYKDVWYGLPSGIAPNPDCGKFVMVATYLCILDDYYQDVLEVGIDRILRGEHDAYALLNMSDDCLVLLNDSPTGNQLIRDLVEDDLYSPYMKVEREEGISFLGNVVYRTERGEVEVAPNVASMFLNWFVPERGTTHPGRKYWALGWRERNLYYMNAPSYGTAREILNKTWREAYPELPPIDSFISLFDKEPPLGGLTNIDRQVMMAPEKLFYQFSPHDVSPEVLAMFQAGFTPDETTSIVSPFFKTL
jgi:hypothetical protein